MVSPDMTVGHHKNGIISINRGDAFALYENGPSLSSSASTGEGGVGVIFIIRCAPSGMAVTQAD
ncbi:MAG: hypothetical protein COW41_06770 [Deltaproteobacteria bacterium CG17_big_fil_post_rev_8_21_14_2_50_51_6]|nr:MAG: hypothetical protein COW41_06770 [Deltaproteobacteria bacterium CG17_big_fil_post_rev_8_21_14_2_50_51_6]